MPKHRSVSITLPACLRLSKRPRTSSPSLSADVGSTYTPDEMRECSPDALIYNHKATKKMLKQTGTSRRRAKRLNSDSSFEPSEFSLSDSTCSSSYGESCSEILKKQLKPKRSPRTRTKIDSSYEPSSSSGVSSNDCTCSSSCGELSLAAGDESGSLSTSESSSYATKTASPLLLSSSEFERVARRSSHAVLKRAKVGADGVSSSDRPDHSSDLYCDREVDGDIKYEGVSDDIPALISLLMTASDNGKEAAANALADLAVDNAENTAAIAQAGGIQLLISMLTNGSDDQKQGAARALAALTIDNAENKIAVAQAGGIQLLISMLTNGSDDKKGGAARALAALAIDDAENKVTIAQAGGILPLVSLLTNGSGYEKEEATWALTELAVDNAENKSAIAAAGGIPALISLATHGSNREKRYAAHALANIQVDPELDDDDDLELEDDSEYESEDYDPELADDSDYESGRDQYGEFYDNFDFDPSYSDDYFPFCFSSFYGYRSRPKFDRKPISVKVLEDGRVGFVNSFHIKEF